MSLNLKYLFTSYHKDGKYICQNEEDKSSINSEKSTFYDVLQEEEKDNPVQIFCLSGEDEFGKKDYLVDLRDGHFEINGIPFATHSLDHNYTNVRLIYFKRRTLQFNQIAGFTGESCVYHLGWQANDNNGANVKHVIQFS